MSSLIIRTPIIARYPWVPSHLPDSSGVCKGHAGGLKVYILLVHKGC